MLKLKPMKEDDGAGVDACAAEDPKLSPCFGVSAVGPADEVDEAEPKIAFVASPLAVGVAVFDCPKEKRGLDGSAGFAAAIEGASNEKAVFFLFAGSSEVEGVDVSNEKARLFDSTGFPAEGSVDAGPNENNALGVSTGVGAEEEVVAAGFIGFTSNENRGGAADVGDADSVVAFATGVGTGAGISCLSCRPKLKVDGAWTGVAVSEDEDDLVPKKSGMPDGVRGRSFSDVDGLPMPVPNVFLGPSPSPANNGGGLAELAALAEGVDCRGMKPSVVGTAGGDSGCATIDPAASGDDARGRVETPFGLSNVPPDSRAADGTARFVGGCSVGFSTGAGAVAVDSAAGAKFPKLMPENEGRGIFACSSSSIGGKSSSLAENRPLPFGDPDLELL